MSQSPITPLRDRCELFIKLGNKLNAEIPSRKASQISTLFQSFTDRWIGPGGDVNLLLSETTVKSINQALANVFDELRRERGAYARSKQNSAFTVNPAEDPNDPGNRPLSDSAGNLLGNEFRRALDEVAALSAMNFQAALSSPALIKELEHICEQYFQSENLQFLVKMERSRNLPEDSRWSLYSELINEHIARNCADPINIDASESNAVNRAAQELKTAKEEGNVAARATAMKKLDVAMEKARTNILGMMESNQPIRQYFARAIATTR